ncbi:TadE/TadG family type IV pilus assembly protein [Sneathiella aquimaris]|uniref:TadE/TadG family type IV pilus assembly protein n=1 Tax=Sneathiella aquimaris TaxID=2599305 RepID=UPI00146DF7D5|nr:hypothetical protein [Sneathiella aquimaris]
MTAVVARSITKFRQNRLGISALELAGICPFLVIVSLLFVDIGRIMIVDGILQSSLGTLVQRIGPLDQEPDTSSLQETFMSVFDDLHQFWVDPQKIDLTVTPTDDQSFQQIYVKYTVDLSTPLVTNLFGDALVQRKFMLPLASPQGHQKGEVH